MAENKKNTENWKEVSSLFSTVITPTKDWTQADCLGDINEMAVHFTNAFPEHQFSIEDLRLALHDMNVPFERNEHNNKWYYLAKWI